MYRDDPMAQNSPDGPDGVEPMSLCDDEASMSDGIDEIEMLQRLAMELERHEQEEAERYLEQVQQELEWFSRNCSSL